MRNKIAILCKSPKTIDEIIDEIGVSAAECQSAVVSLLLEDILIESRGRYQTTDKFQEPILSSSYKGLSSGYVRATFIVHESLNEKIKAIAYWDRLTVKEVIQEALQLYVKDKNVKPIPKRSNANE